jgi:hypothetical protein
MTHSDLRAFILIGALAGNVPSAFASQPPDVVASDDAGDTAMGTGALALNSGDDNTAAGFNTLNHNTTGSANTAIGTFALIDNTTGSNNTAAGFDALQANTTGNGNTADGYSALTANTMGNYNSAFGYKAFAANTTGSYTTAVGAYALGLNITGGYDTAFGAFSLPANTSGTGNTAFGYAALRSTTTGNSNIGFGYQALYLDSTGSNNIAMGYQAASNVNTGSNIIEIGNVGAGGDNNVIKIGTQGTQKATYIAGIAGVTVTGSAVYVTSSGQLGVLASSGGGGGYGVGGTVITPMGKNTEKLRQLRPVSFHLKSDPKGALQYGLIAEEVDKVYPELVIRDDTGKIQGVRYDELAPMLLNEMQQQQRITAAQTAEIRDLKQKQQIQLAAQSEHAAAQDAEIRALKQQVAGFADLKQELHAALRQMQAKETLVAQR